MKTDDEHIHTEDSTTVDDIEDRLGRAKGRHKQRLIERRRRYREYLQLKKERRQRIEDELDPGPEVPPPDTDDLDTQDEGDPDPDNPAPLEPQPPFRKRPPRPGRP